MSNINSSVEKRPYFYKLLDEKHKVELPKCMHEVFYFPLFEMKEHLLNKPTIPFISNCQVNVPVQRHLDALPSEPSTQNEAFLKGNNPLHSIKFKDVNLKSLRKLVKDKQFSNRRLVSLRNLLVKRKKEESGNSIVTVFARMDDELKVSYIVHFDNDLLTKLIQALECIVVFVHVRIEWAEKAELDQPRERQWAQYECDPYEIKRENLFNTNVEIPVNLINSSEGVGVSKKVLTRLGSNDNLVFNWNVAIQFEEIASEDLRIQRRLTPDQDLYHMADSAKDVTFIASNGDEIKCHRKVLIEMSANFWSGSENGTLDRIEIKESSTEALKLFVKFLYGFEIQESSLKPDWAIELLKLSNRYEVKTLEEALVEFFISKPFSWFSIGNLMELYFFAKDKQSLEEIRIHALTELTELNKKDLDKCEYFKNLPQKEAISLLLLVLEWK